jgi:cobalt-zinc-cadmium efflux system outer membrane protein
MRDVRTRDLTARTFSLRHTGPRGIGGILVAGMLLASCGCRSPAVYRLTDRSFVAHEVRHRFGKSLGPAACPRRIIYPHGISLRDELTEERAVLLALWNNAQFLETLTDLGVAQGDLVQAGLLPDPELWYIFPVTDKPFRYLFDFPIESLWLRPIRVAAAQRELNRVGERLSQVALDLIRDTRQGFADAVLAFGRREVAHQAVDIRKRIAELAKQRLDAGDISRQEYSAALIEFHIAEQDAARIDYDVGITEERLRNLMGVSDDRTPLNIRRAPDEFPAPPAVEPLVQEAIRTRPDALAAVQAVDAAVERLRLARISWFRLLGILDGSGGRLTGHEFGPGFRVTLPLWNWNQGNIARAEAELERAERQRQTINNQIVQDVYQAFLRYSQTQAELKVLDTLVRPEAEETLDRTELAYKEGNTSYVVVLQTTQQLINSRLRQFQLQADLLRFWAELERSVGRHLNDLPRPLPTPLPVPRNFPVDAPLEKIEAPAPETLLDGQLQLQGFQPPWPLTHNEPVTERRIETDLQATPPTADEESAVPTSIPGDVEATSPVEVHAS